MIREVVKENSIRIYKVSNYSPLLRDLVMRFVTQSTNTSWFCFVLCLESSKFNSKKDKELVIKPISWLPKTY